MAGLLDTLLAARSVMDPNQRTPDQEFARGLARSLLGTGASLADMASMAIPGRPIGASLRAAQQQQPAGRRRTLCGAVRPAERRPARNAA